MWRPGSPILGTATTDPSPRENIVREISNFRRRMEAVLRHGGSAYAFVYSKARAPKVRGIPPAEIVGIAVL